MYANLITFFTVWALLQLSILTLLGVKLGSLNLALVASLGVLATISFLILATRSLEFFDPAVLSGFVARDLVKWMSLASRRDLHRSDHSFQAYYQGQAEETVRTFHLLAEFIIEKGKNVRSTGLADLCTNGLRALVAYAAIKQEIPTDSLWFRRTPAHKDWLLAESSALEMALATSTTVGPDQVPDPLWLESDLSGTLVMSLKATLDRSDFRSAMAIGASLTGTLRRVASLSTDEALLIFQRLGPLMVSAAAQRATQRRATPGQSPEAVLEAYSLSLIAILLGAFDGIRACVSALTTGEKQAWRLERGLGQLPRQVLERAEFIRNRLAFERAVEGQVLTQPWYIHQMLSHAFLTYCDASLRGVMSELEAEVARIKRGIGSNPSYTVQFLQRALEGCEKYAQHSSEVRPLVEGLGSRARRVEDIEWVKIDWAGLDLRLASAKRALMQTLASQVGWLVTHPKVKGEPDSLGYAYTILAEECFSAMMAANETLFADVFRAFMVASIASTIACERNCHRKTRPRS